jgi:hypothetical protein
MRRVKGLSENLGGRIPSIKVTTPESFFERLEQRVNEGMDREWHE